jgi:HEAT repeat protein
LEDNPTEQALIKALQISPTDPNRARAWEALAKMAPRTRAGILCKALTSGLSETREDIVEALANIGADAVPNLIPVLRSELPYVRREAACALGLIGPDAAAAVPALIELLQDQVPSVRRKACFALGGIGPKSKTAVPQLMVFARQKSNSARLEAITSLGRIRAELRDVVPLLMDIAGENDAQVRLTVVVALGHIGPSAEAAVPLVVEFIRTSTVDDQITGLIALSKMEPEARPVLPVLSGLVDQKMSPARQWAIVALGKVKPPAADAVPVLEAVLEEPVGPHPITAAQGLWRIGCREKALPFLRKVLEGADGINLSHALRAVEELGTQAKEFGPVVLNVWQSQKEPRRRQSASALKAIDPELARKAGIK